MIEKTKKNNNIVYKMSWVEHVKDYAKKNGVHYKQALKDAKESYKPVKKEKSEKSEKSEKPKKPKKVKEEPKEVTEGVVVKVKKMKSDEVKMKKEMKKKMDY
jgi:hypothetical protein